MADLLCELCIEEMPSRFQVGAETAFLESIKQGLIDKGLSFETIQSFSTPRRLAVIVKGLPSVSPDMHTERKGPSVNAPEQALQGFLKSVGMAKDDLEVRNTPKGDVYFAVMHQKGQDTKSMLSQVINTAICQIPWAKSMRFADYTFRFVRPLQRIVVVFDGKGVDGELDLGNSASLPYTDTTLGHRFMSDGCVQVNADTYQKALEESHVIVCRQTRKDIILNGLNEHASSQGVKLIYDEGLLEEVVGLVEEPSVLMGAIPTRFMRLPPEVLITSLREHQKFFVFENADGTLAPYFATVANIQASDGGKAIIHGNQKVLNARLSDSLFFYDNDIQKWSTYTNNTDLQNMTFHAKLGTVKDRVYRIEYLSRTIAQYLSYDEQITYKVYNSAHICKSDLVSEMVFEFPELQGVMGTYYALQAGNDPQIANAIKDHYKPRGAHDAVPSDKVAIAIALAEKMDTLCGFWLIGETPTGSKDPYALRRCALGILRIVLENKLPLDIMKIVDKGFEVYAEMNVHTNTIDDVRNDLQHFFIERLKHALKSEGIRHDYIGAVLSNGLDNTIVDKVHLARVMMENSDVVSQVKSAHIRASSIVEKAEGFVADGVDTDIFTNPLETNLVDALTDAFNRIEFAKTTNDFVSMMRILSDLNTPLNAFFEGVMVNDADENIRQNRLNILSAVMQTVNEVANFNGIEK